LTLSYILFGSLSQAGAQAARRYREEVASTGSADSIGQTGETATGRRDPDRPAELSSTAKTVRKEE
jgi:hypothetical protein